MPTTAVRLMTFSDAIEHLLDVFDLDYGRRPFRNARRAVLNTYRDFPNLANWTYYFRRAQVVTVAPYMTGTVTYQVSTNKVTLSGGAWPDWAEWGEILLTKTPAQGGVRYKVDQRLSDTELTLSPQTVPGEDIPSQNYTLYRSLYPMPEPFTRCGPFVEVTTSYWPDNVSPNELLDRLVGNYQPQRPYMYAFRTTGLDEFPGRPQVEFGPPPSESRTYDFIYQAATRPLFIEGESASVTVSGRNLAGGPFKPEMEGSVIRFAETSSSPTNRIGKPDEGNDSSETLYFPYLDEGVIQTVTDASNAILSEPLSRDYSSHQCLISDLIDIETGPMQTLLHRCMELEFISTHYFDDSGRYQAARVRYEEALRNAMGWDSKNMDFNLGSKGRYFDRLRDWAIFTE